MRLIAAVVLLASFTAQAQTGSATLFWAHDGKNVDGTNASLVGFKVYYGLNGTFTNSKTVAGGATRTYAVTNLAPGNWSFELTAIDSEGDESSRSNVAVKLVGTAVPTPPGMLAPKTVAGPVYTLQITRDAVVLPQAGTVTAGKPCDPSQQLAYAGKTYMLLINVADATALPGIALEAAWATCQ